MKKGYRLPIGKYIILTMPDKTIVTHHIKNKVMDILSDGINIRYILFDNYELYYNTKWGTWRILGRSDGFIKYKANVSSIRCDEKEYVNPANKNRGQG